jgi:hypothetical protein
MEIKILAGESHYKMYLKDASSFDNNNNNNNNNNNS